MRKPFLAEKRRWHAVDSLHGVIVSHVWLHQLRLLQLRRRLQCVDVLKHHTLSRNDYFLCQVKCIFDTGQQLIYNWGPKIRNIVTRTSWNNAAVGGTWTDGGESRPCCPQACVAGLLAGDSESCSRLSHETADQGADEVQISQYICTCQKMHWAWLSLVCVYLHQ